MTRTHWRCDSCGLPFVTFSRRQPEECHACHLPSVRRDWSPNMDMYPPAMLDENADWYRDAATEGSA